MIYAEIVLLKYFICHLFIFLLINKLFALRQNYKSIILISFIYGLIGVFYYIHPVFTSYARYIFLIIFFFYIYSRKRKAYVALLTIIIELLFLRIKIPPLICIMGILFVSCVKYPLIGLKRIKNYYLCEVSDGRRFVRTMAYYDSGNRVFAENGEPVVLADKNVYNRLAGPETDICISTVTGIGVVPIKDGLIRFSGRSNAKKVKVALSPKRLVKYGLILHSDLLGGI